MNASLAARVLRHVETETARLAIDPSFDLTASTQTKARLLAELRRSDPVHAGSAQELEQLRAELARNADELAAQLTAVREIAAIIMSTVRNDASDGTYGSSQRFSRHVSH